MTFDRARLSLAALATAAGLCAAFAPAQAQQAAALRARYGVTLMGLPLGVATLNGEFGPHYRLEAGAKLSGLASMVSNSHGGATASGAIVEGRVLPQGYATTATNSEMTRTVRMAQSNGAATAVEIKPPFDEKPDRVALTDAHRRGVVDPLSALVMPGPLAPETCNRRLPVFDGYTRFDVTLGYKGTKQVKTQGYAGPVMICSARYTPVAGHRPDRPATKYMAANRNMEVWLAPVGASGVVAPLRISVKTQIGVVTIDANAFETTPR
jgi:hypothetical protein